MKYSKLFGKTIKKVSEDEVSNNAKLLTLGGFVRREMAGVYNFLPIGVKVLNKISQIVREEMNSTGAQEVLLSSLQNKENWEKTGRWQTMDVLFKVMSQLHTEYALGPTHEEVLVPLVKQFVNSYKDLPLYLYQIQTKFRDEARAKSGILRGREFLMKDLYSFHADEGDFNVYYERSKEAYMNVFKRCGLDAILTEASGGAFSKYSHEFQVLTPYGEDIIYYCENCKFSQNREIATVKAGDKCEKCSNGLIKEGKSIEVGNIFPLKTRFSDAFGLTYKDQDDNYQKVIMGCYGIGISRLMGAVVEIHHDDKGIIWPESVAPYKVHLIALHAQDNERLKMAEEVYKKLMNAGIEVLFDERDISNGEKFADADLIGIPYQIYIAANTNLNNYVEFAKRSEKRNKVRSKVYGLNKIIEILNS